MARAGEATKTGICLEVLGYRLDQQVETLLNHKSKANKKDKALELIGHYATVIKDLAPFDAFGKAEVQGKVHELVKRIKPKSGGVRMKPALDTLKQLREDLGGKPEKKKEKTRRIE